MFKRCSLNVPKRFFHFRPLGFRRQCAYFGTLVPHSVFLLKAHPEIEVVEVYGRHHDVINVYARFLVEYGLHRVQRVGLAVFLHIGAPVDFDANA